MSHITKLCVVCVAGEHDPEEAQLLDDFDILCYNCLQPIGLKYGKEVYLLWREEEADATDVEIGEDD